MKTGKPITSKNRHIRSADQEFAGLIAGLAGCSLYTMLLVFLFLLPMIMIPGLLFAEETAKKQTIVMYSFQVIDKTTGNGKIRIKKGKDSGVYSFIIPDTITKNIIASGKYEVIRDRDIYTINETFATGKDESQYIKTLQKTGRERKADFIISGTCVISDDCLEIRAVIFNVKGGNLTPVTGKSSEPGVLLRDSTDFTASGIDSAITAMNISNEEKFRPSPFTDANTALGIFSLGIDGGYMYISGKWKEAYKPAMYISPCLTADLPRNFGLQLRYDYTELNNGDQGLSTLTISWIRGTSLSLVYNLNLAGNLYLFAACGGGVSFTRTVVNPGPPFTFPSSETKTVDPLFEFSSGLKLGFSIFSIKGGIMYRNIFYDKNNMNCVVFFAGATVNL